MNVDLYLRVREKEGRLYSDDLVTRLPAIPDGHPLADEWRARSASASRLTRYLSRRPQPILLLDLGCGNGWLSSLLAASGQCVLGMDKNWIELHQAARVFSSNPNVSFLEADIFSAPMPLGSFDAIILASIIQYFRDLPALLRVLLSFLKPQGEIHILDSPLYADAEVTRAAQRSAEYYFTLGFPEMAEQYFHHPISDLSGYAARWLYHPSRWKRWARSFDSPFPWVVIVKPEVEQHEATISEAFSRTAQK